MTASTPVDMTVAEFVVRLGDTENPLTQALDVLHGEGKWSESDADALYNAIVAATGQARADAAAGVPVP